MYDCVKFDLSFSKIHCELGALSIMWHFNCCYTMFIIIWALILCPLQKIRLWGIKNEISVRIASNVPSERLGTITDIALAPPIRNTVQLDRHSGGGPLDDKINLVKSNQRFHNYYGFNRNLDTDRWYWDGCPIPTVHKKFNSF